MNQIPGLDPQTSSVIDILIQELTYEYGITTIINTHDMNSVLSIGDSIELFIPGGSGGQAARKRSFIWGTRN